MCAARALRATRAVLSWVKGYNAVPSKCWTLRTLLQNYLTQAEVQLRAATVTAPLPERAASRSQGTRTHKKQAAAGKTASDRSSTTAQAQQLKLQS